LNTIIKAVETKNIPAEGGKMVAKGEGIQLRKRYAFFKLDYPSTIFRSG